MRWCLDMGEVISIDRPGEGGCLVCLQGRVWVTTGDGRDYFLRGGERREVGDQGRIVLEAMTEAVVTLASPTDRAPVPLSCLGGIFPAAHRTRQTS